MVRFYALDQVGVATALVEVSGEGAYDRRQLAHSLGIFSGLAPEYLNLEFSLNRNLRSSHLFAHNSFFFIKVKAAF